MTELEKMKLGMLYDANNNPEIVKKRYEAFDLCFYLNQTLPTDMEKKNNLIKQILGYLPENLEIVTPFYCEDVYKRQVLLILVKLVLSLDLVLII